MDPELTHGSCTHTQKQNEPWWRLQLPGVYRVSEIEVTNRKTNQWRLNGVEILIGNSLVNNGNSNPRDLDLDLLSIRGPEDQETINELVASATFPLTSHLWVGLHRSDRRSEQGALL
ncbi:hypothetical protein CRUP_019659 [Coryphaenoides rupestris]|nr:hypothetical protein CRUP_019659 [Coryphaenoides rupestris]